MKVAQAIAQALYAEGIRLVAGITGQSIGHVADALAECPGMSVFYTRQERVAFDICDGYARASGLPGVVFTDAGPAAANAMGGLVNSAGDSVPVLFFVGHNDRFEVPSGQTKEIPMHELFSPVSKWVATIEDGSQVSTIIRRAFMHLRTGRPGPVVIGMPYDVSSMDVGNFEYAAVSSKPKVRSGADPLAIEAAVKALAAASNPYLYVGAGILTSEATPELVGLAELLTLPVATTLNGKSAFPEDHRLSLGIGGFRRALYGSYPAAIQAERADVICTVGCGFKRHASMVRPAESVQHIQIDVDPGELNRDHVADIAMLGDAKIILAQMIAVAEKLDKARLAPVESRLEEVDDMKRRWSDLSKPLLTSDEAPINPFRITHELNNALNRSDAIVLHDAGSVRGSTAQHYLSAQPRSFLGFGVQSAMGWTIGAAMGAKTAAPGKLVVAVVGEEAFCETALDIETSIRCNAAILVIVANNRAFTDRDGGSSPTLANIRFGTKMEIGNLASALGAKAFKVEQPEKIAPALKEAIASVNAGTTAVVEIFTRRVKTSLYYLWEQPS
jgi:acetolactate synthase-1/2/3 large subunit